MLWMAESEIGLRIKEAASSIGGLNKLSEVVGIARRTLGDQLVKDEQKLSFLLQVSKSTGYDLQWLATGEGQKLRDQSKAQSREPGTATSDFIALPFLDVQASAGHGAVVAMHEEAKSVVSFERAFLRNLGAVPDHCKIISARGDSMTPTIPDGALIVVDHSQREVVNGWISVVNVCGDLLVKRIRRRLDGTVELVSDNTIYPVETIGPDRIDQLTIIGRVVYFCRAP